MSSGAFTTSKYEANSGTVYGIKVQPETLAANVGAANAAPAGVVDGEGSVRVGGGNRQLGIKARSVSVRFTATVPDGYLAGQTYRIPILTPTVWNGANKGTTGTYLGSPIVVVGKSPERVV